MPRRLRIHLANGFYHVTLLGNHQQAIFHTVQDRQLLNVIVAESIERHAAQVHAYCWMTNHLHLLVRVSDEPLGHVMRLIASKYAKAFQRKLDTSGHLFERRYFARLIDGDAYLMAVLRYIHLNPVAAGLTPSAAEYPWSSHHAYGGGSAESWLTMDFVLALFGSDRIAAPRILPTGSSSPKAIRIGCPTTSNHRWRQHCGRSAPRRLEAPARRRISPDPSINCSSRHVSDSRSPPRSCCRQAARRAWSPRGVC